MSSSHNPFPDLPLPGLTKTPLVERLHRKKEEEEAAKRNAENTQETSASKEKRDSKHDSKKHDSNHDSKDDKRNSQRDSAIKRFSGLFSRGSSRGSKNQEAAAQSEYTFTFHLVGHKSTNDFSLLKTFCDDQKRDESLSLISYHNQKTITLENTLIQIDATEHPNSAVDAQTVMKSINIKNTQAILVTFDITDKKSFADTRVWLAHLENEIATHIPNEGNFQEILNATKELPSIILVGTKADEENKHQNLDIIDTKKFISDYNIDPRHKIKIDTYIEVSVQKNTDVTKLFETVAQTILEQQIKPYTSLILLYQLNAILKKQTGLNTPKHINEMLEVFRSLNTSKQATIHGIHGILATITDTANPPGGIFGRYEEVNELYKFLRDLFGIEKIIENRPSSGLKM